MPTLELVVGEVLLPALELPETCTSVGALRDCFTAGFLGQRVQEVERLKFMKDSGGSPSSDKAALPPKLFVEGPPSNLKALIFLVKRSFMQPPESAREGRRTARAAQKTPVSARDKSRTGRQVGGRGGGTPDEAALALNSEAALAVLKLWFEELTPDDWFRQSHSLDDRIREEFASLHARAAAGELSGWTSRPDTCLALVILLDQFSRFLYRGTPAAYACDRAAMAAANIALARGDDRLWPPGPRRSALYLPFMHSEDLLDKRRCLAMMREGLRPESDWSKLTDTAGHGDVRKGATKVVNLVPAQAQGPAGVPVLPRLNAAQPSPRGGHRPSFGGKATEKAPAAAGRRRSAEEDPEDSEGSDSDTSSGSAPFAGTGVGGAGGHGMGHAVPYSPQAALDLPILPKLSLSHGHAKRFRSMRFDLQTQQAYMRDRNDVNRIVKYQCLLCNVPHELKLGLGPMVAEHQHL